jgi:azurin
MKLKLILFSSLFLLCIAISLSAAPPPAKRVTITGYDTLKYSVTTIEASPGQSIIVELVNAGSQPKETMGHNWILLKAGVDPIAYANAAATAKAENYQPKAQAGKVLASIRLLGPKERALTSFTAPTTPGTYHYLCSFPGHTQGGMAGTLVVK